MFISFAYQILAVLCVKRISGFLEFFMFYEVYLSSENLELTLVWQKVRILLYKPNIDLSFTYLTATGSNQGNFQAWNISKGCLKF